MAIPANANANTSRTSFRAMCEHHHGHGGGTYAPLIDRAYSFRKWKQRDPRSPLQKRRLAHHRECAHTQDTLAWMKRSARRHRGRFYDYRKAKLAEQAQQSAIDPPGAAYLYQLRMCESGGNYSTNTGNGFYGAYQFVLSTWQSVGGSGYPHLASPAEQDYRAAVLWRREGSGPWPVCG